MAVTPFQSRILGLLANEDVKVVRVMSQAESLLTY